MRKGKLSYSILLVLLVNVLIAQHSKLVINFPSSEYSSHRQTWAIAQDSTGLMYFANTGGLLVYNASDWELTPLPNSQILRTIALDSAQRVYAGAYELFGYWEQEGVFSEELFNDVSKGKEMLDFEGEEIWQIVVKDEDVYFQSFGKIFKYSSGELKSFLPPFSIMLIQKVNNQILVPVIDIGVFLLNEEGEFVFFDETTVLKGMRISCILPYGEKDMLIGTEHNGLFLWKENEITPWGGNVNTRLKKAQINKGLQLTDGSYAFGTILNGVYILSKAGRIIAHYDIKNGLQNNTVLCLFEDVDQSLWCGLDNGVDLIMRNSLLKYYMGFDQEIGTVYDVKWNEDYCFVGTNRGVFRADYDQNDDIFIFKKWQLIDQSQGQIWDIFFHENEILVGHNEGVLVLSSKGQYKYKIDLPGVWQMKYPHSSNEFIYAGTYRGLYRLEKHNGKWQSQSVPLATHLPIRKMHFLSDSVLIGKNLNQGVFIIQLNAVGNDGLYPVEYLDKKKGFMSGTRADFFVKDDLVYVKSSSNDHYKVFTNEEHSDIADTISFDSDCEKIVAVNDELIYVYDGKLKYKNEGHIQILNAKVQKNEEGQVYGFDSTLVICMDKGFAYLPHAIWGNKVGGIDDGEVHLIRVEVNGLPLKLNQKNGSKYDLDVHQNNLTFHFFVPEYTLQPGFKYRLYGYDPKWSDWMFSSRLEFNNLNAGVYRLEVISDVAELPLVFDFEIETPIWRRSWMMLLYVFLGVLLFFGGAVLVNWQMTRKYKRMKALKEKKLQDIRTRMENQQLQMAVRSKNKEIANTAANLMQKNKILLQLKEAVIQLSKTSGSHFSGKSIQKIIHLIDVNRTTDADWKLFETHFKEINESFYKKLVNKHPHLTPGDLKLAAYLKLNLSSKEIAALMNISVRGVENKRYRLRKHLNLASATSLVDYLNRF